MPNTELLDAPPVCMRTLTRSSGWPTRTAHAPPTPPDINDLTALSDFLAGASFSCSMMAGVDGFVGWAGTTTAVAGMSDVVDMLLLIWYCYLDLLIVMVRRLQAIAATVLH